MIICPEHRFVFVHIPKCAGTSIRTQLMKCDAQHVSLGEVGRHPVLGKIDYGHIPLAVLRQHFPEHYASIRDFNTFAVVRDPLDRFGSSLRQVLWRYENRPMTLIPNDELRHKTLSMLDEIASEIDAPSARLIFFARQTDFIFDDETRLVEHLIPLDLVPEFLGYMGRRTGTPLVTTTRSNQNVDLRYGVLGPVAFRINDVLRRSLPLDLHARIKTLGVRMLTRPGSAAEASGVLDLPEVQDFVAEFYARDAEIYRSVVKGRDHLRRALTEDSLENTVLGGGVA